MIAGGRASVDSLDLTEPLAEITLQDVPAVGLGAAAPVARTRILWVHEAYFLRALALLGGKPSTER